MSYYLRCRPSAVEGGGALFLTRVSRFSPSVPQTLSALLHSRSGGLFLVPNKSLLEAFTCCQLQWSMKWQEDFSKGCLFPQKLRLCCSLRLGSQGPELAPTTPSLNTNCDFSLYQNVHICVHCSSGSGERSLLQWKGDSQWGYCYVGYERACKTQLYA